MRALPGPLRWRFETAVLTSENEYPSDLLVFSWQEDMP